MLKNNKIIKEYHALTHGKTENLFEIKIKQEILNNYNKKIKPLKNITHTTFKTIKSNLGFSLIKAFPKTGKMHQIRIHLAYIGNPIVCDNKYGNIALNKEFKKYGYYKLFLHSASIKFNCPITNEKIIIKAPYDDKMNAILKKIGIINNE